MSTRYCQSSCSYQYRRTPGGEPTVIERLETPLLLTFSRLMELIDAREGITPVNLPDGQQLQIKDFPHVPVRESTRERLIHGDHPAGVADSDRTFAGRSAFVTWPSGGWDYTSQHHHS